TPAQAMYHFLSGYTAKVAGTEKGLVGVQPEFSTCFGAPFLPRPPAEYGNLLRDYISRHNVDCWLVNSGWTGGIYGVGRRMPIRATRALVTGALDGSLRNVNFRTDPYFGFSVPTSVPGVEPHLLYPFKTWRDKSAFDETARKLVSKQIVEGGERRLDHIHGAQHRAQACLHGLEAFWRREASWRATAGLQDAACLHECVLKIA